MSRKKVVRKAREIAGDPIYNDFWIAKFVNCVMLNGKKSAVYRHFYTAIDKIKQEEKLKDEDVVSYFHETLSKVSPEFVLKTRIFGGSRYQIPVAQTKEQKTKVAIKILSKTIKTMSGKGLTDRIYSELLNINKETGKTVEKVKEMLRMAAANKAFADIR